MFMKHLVFFFLFLSFSASSQQSNLKQTIKGIVLDEQSGNTLAGATVVIETAQSSISAVSDSVGYFRLEQVPIGRQTIRISSIGFEEALVRNIEVTSSKEVVLEVRLKENIRKLDEVIVNAGRQKNRALNEAALVSARQLSMDEAVRYSGTRNDPSRMAQNFAGVSGSNDARNDIIIRGNSPAGVLWRMDGIDIPNPNHYSTLGSTGGPVTILNTNTLKSSDFLTGAFPAQYGNALSGVFDLRMRNGNNERYEYLGQAGFNGFELGAEGPLNKNSKSSFLVNYRYSLVAAIQAVGLNVGTGDATPYYQDAHFKFNIPTKKLGTFSWFGLGGESHIRFAPDTQEKENLYASPDGSIRDRSYRSITGVTGLTHQYFFDPNTSGKFVLALSGFRFRGNEDIVSENKPPKNAFDFKDRQVKYSAGYTFNKKISAKNQFTAGVIADINKLKLDQSLIKDGDSVLTNIVSTRETASLLRSFANWSHRFSDKVSSNFGVFSQFFMLNNTWSIEPRWNIKYQFRPNQSLSFGTGLHSQTQPLEVYFYRTTTNTGQTLLTNKNLDFTKSGHAVAGYDINPSRHLRFKAEVYGQYIFDAAVEQTPSSFSMLNAGADFGFPDKTFLVNEGKGYNYGLELTMERFLNKGFYYLVTASVFQSKYKGSDNKWRNTAFSQNIVTNILGGKEFKLTERSSFGIDTKLALAGGQRYTPFDVEESLENGYVVYKETEAFSLRNDPYWRWDLKFSYTRNGRNTTQKWYVDFQNLTNNKNLYIRTLNPKTAVIGEINQIGFFPNINYQITF
jgi:hypothetical protein